MPISLQTKHTAITNRATHNLDAADQTVGRLSTQIAKLLMGKHKATYSQHTDCGDAVVVSNVAKLRFTGKKLEQKEYYHHSGYPGGLKTTKMKDVLADKPSEVLKHAVYRMLPKNRLRDRIIKRLTFTK